MKQQRGREKVFARSVRRDDRPSGAATAVAAAGTATNHDNGDIFQTVPLRIRIPLRATTYAVYIASVIKGTYPFLPKERGNKLSRTAFPTVTFPPQRPNPLCFSFPFIALHSVCFDDFYPPAAPPSNPHAVRIC